MAAPAFIAKGTKGTTAGGTASFTYMGSINQYDLLFLFVYDSGLAPSYTINASWNFIGNTTFSGTTNVRLYWKKATGSESGSENVQRDFGYTLGVLFVQVYQYRGTSFVGIEDSQWTSGTSGTISWTGVTVGGTERTLIAFCTNEADPGTPTGYTNSATDDDGTTFMECNTFENQSSDGTVTSATGVTGWATFHLSILNNSNIRSFIVN